MKFKIIYKLFILATLPILTLLLFSVNHIKDKYFALQSHEKYLKYSELIKKSGDLLHELQIERGLSSSYLNNIDSAYFETKLHKQKTITTSAYIAFKKYNSSLNKTILSAVSIDLLSKINEGIIDLNKIRGEIKNQKITSENSFNYYTNLNNVLLSLVHSLKVYSNNEQIYDEILALKELLILQELAGQERAHVAYFIHKSHISSNNMQKLQILILSQDEKYNSIKPLLLNSQISTYIDDIHDKYLDTYFNTSRQLIQKYNSKRYLTNEIYKTIGFGGMIYDITQFQRTENTIFYKEYLVKEKKCNDLIREYIKFTDNDSIEYLTILRLQNIFKEISESPQKPFDEAKILEMYNILDAQAISLNPIQWFEISTQRINEIHDVEINLIVSINNQIRENQNDLQNSLFYQILLTLGTILFLVFGAHFISNNINKSIKNLNKGIEEFFYYLNFKQKSVNVVYTNSDDELNDIAQEINNQINITQENLKNDKNFINETTQIVTSMKNGDFSKKVYSNPKNPNLIELKTVLDQLIELISQKIKEQTTSLEVLNSSLEDKVFHQTIELQNKVKELTIARDDAVKAEIAKDDFLANMSHEIRTPLNAILGFVAILKRSIKDEKQKSYLTIIDTSGISLLAIINDILDFSKIQSGKFTITPHPIDPEEEFSSTALLFASKAYEKHLLYAIYIDPALPKTIITDSMRVRQIFSNLLSNAIKFTPEKGEIKVKVICEDNTLIISVQDSGIGISKENLLKVFEAFEQADGSTTRKYGGTGLGLSISSKLASLMDGTLILKSEEGKGSIFTLSIPVEVVESKPKEIYNLSKMSNLRFAVLGSSPICFTYKKLIKKYLLGFGISNIINLDKYQEKGYDILFFVPDDEYNDDIINSKVPAIAIIRSETVTLASSNHISLLYAPFVPSSIVQSFNDIDITKIKIISSNQVQKEQNPQAKYQGKILVAEDNKTNQILISILLEDYGIDHVIANNGIEAVKLFKENKFDMVLMDENMPELNGIAAMKQIKEFEKNNFFTFTPIIVFTASVFETDREMFIREGMDGFVGKPIEKNELESEIEKYLKKIK